VPIPGDIIFGPGLNNSPKINFREARALTNENDKLELLKLRLDTLMINQIDGISHKDEMNNLKIWSPIPLTYLTCLACETLGRVIIGNENKIKKDDVSRHASILIFDEIDKAFSRNPKKKFKVQMKKIWSNDDLSKMNSYSFIFYKYLRTSFAHGYRAKNIFLNHKLEIGFEIKEGFLVINPYWFWDRFKIVYHEVFTEIFNSNKTNNTYRNNALFYFDELIKK